MIIVEDSYEVSEPTIDSYIVKAEGAGADVFMNITTPKFAAQAIKKNAELGPKPVHFLNNVSGSIGGEISALPASRNAGYIICVAIFRRPDRREAEDRQGHDRVNEFFWMLYYPEANCADASVMYAYIVLAGPRACTPGGLRRQPDPPEHRKAGSRHS